MTYYDEIAEGYNELHKAEQEQKLKIVKQYIQPKQNESLLDVGCGTGVSTQFNCNCTGIDPSEKLIDIAKQSYPNKKFLVGKAEELPFPDKSFDYVISLTAVQNFDDVKKSISEIKRVAKGNAKIVISILKKSDKVKLLKTLLNNYKMIEQEKDLMFIKD